jgi:crotonobetainyl-CoA:carnitine CoA-transferase CaiB-like acyl-CoA transferase
MSITGPANGPPCKVGVALTDVLTGLYAAVAILTCLRARERTGHGYAIDLALLDCAVASQVNVAQAYLTSGKVPARQGNAHLQIVPYQLFATLDGWIVLNVGNDGQWRHFCEAAGASSLAAEARFATNSLRVENRECLIPLVEELMRSRSTKEWQERLRRWNVPHAQVWDYAELFANEQIAARGMKIEVRDPAGAPVDLIGSPLHVDGLPSTVAAPPQLGAHTGEILRELLQFDDRQLEELRKIKAI